MKDLIIIGAGLSGLRAAMRAEEQALDYQVLEARDRIGGRALGERGLDLGPSWIWPAHQPRVHALTQALGLRTFAQFEDGAFRYETASGVQSLRFPSRYQDAARIDGGPSALASAMARRLGAGRVRLNAEVSAIAAQSEHSTVSLVDGERIEARRLLIAVPPRLVLQWSFTPSPPERLRRDLGLWSTWMAAHAKVFFQYETAFWREAGLSGGAVSQIGPLMEVVDHSDADTGAYALFGFYGWPSAVRQRKVDALMDETLAQLTRLFGPQAREPIHVAFKDWSTDPFTAVPEDSPGPSEHPRYGAPALSELWFGGQVAFAGAEAARDHGGLIEGALEAADASFERLMSDGA